MTISYKEAGVDISAGNEAVNLIKDKVARTYSDAVLTPLGGFAGMIDLSKVLIGYNHPVLVQSIDGVGTKTIIAHMMGKYDTLGSDVLSACSNDILVMGAKPITFLDYIAFDRLKPDMVETLVGGMASACLAHGISLLGGETAEMPDVYLKDEIDLVGIVTGVLEKEKIIDGSQITPGDHVLGFLSNGLHTNGYSLARRLFFKEKGISPHATLSELGGKSLGDVLLAPHLNYVKPVHALLDVGFSIKGMAHITGGGLIENIPRVLPKGSAIAIDQNNWAVPPIFRLMQSIGDIPDAEMFRSFNMGIGFVLIVDEKEAKAIQAYIAPLPDFTLIPIGQVVSGKKEVMIR